MTVPVMMIAMPISRWAVTSDHLRLTASASIPAGTSQASATTPCTTPMLTNWNADKLASITK